MVCLHFEVYLLASLPPPTLHPFVSTCDTTSLVQLLRFSILFGRKLYKQLQVMEVAWKVTD